MFEMFKNKSKKQVKKGDKSRLKFRRFIGAHNSAMNNFSASSSRINEEIRGDYKSLVLRARALFHENEIVSAYINLMIRNVVGDKGFTLNVRAYNEDGTADTIANQQIENFWYDYTTNYKKYITADETQNEVDFDKLILQTLLIDGEVFLHKVKNKNSPYVIRYQIIDCLDVDTQKNGECPNGKDRVIMGIKVDEYFKPLSYFVNKKRNTNIYTSGNNEQIPASEIIHIYRKQYAGQVRGFTALAPVIQCLNGLQTYKRAEIDASLLNACYMGIYEKTGANSSYEAFNDEEIDEDGNIATEIQPNTFRFAPDGYTLKSIQSNHPNSNISLFIKSVIKGISASLGVSSNKLNSDYQSVNYSSLRQANQEDIAAWREMQQFLIDNWKNIQYAEFLKYLLISDLTNLPYSKIDKFMVHEFRGKGWEYLDPVKEYTSIKLKLEMKLTNPIIEIEKMGYDVDDVLTGWQVWKQKLKERNIEENETGNIIEQALNDNDEIQEIDEQN